MDPIVNIDGLIEEAKTYQNDLRTLPYGVLIPELNRLGISLKQVANIDVGTSGQRKGNTLKPYSPDVAIANETEIYKLSQRELKVEKAYVSFKDNITLYNGAKVLNNPQAGAGLNQSKEHPLRSLITAGIVTTASEDLLYTSVFHGVRNTMDQTPNGVCDGFFKKIEDETVALNISVANKNLVATGAINPPVDANDTTAVDQLIAFVRSANPFLRRVKSILYFTEVVYNAAIDALENKLKYKGAVLEDLQRYINGKSGSRVTIIVSDAFGVGDKIVLTLPGNFEFGMNTFGDQDFVQVRNPWEDPNLIQFWLQLDAGTRINDIHQKVFCTNDGSSIPSGLSGDYQ